MSTALRQSSELHFYCANLSLLLPTCAGGQQESQADIIEQVSASCKRERQGGGE